MPQMGPLPWVSLLMSVLFTLMVIWTDIFFVWSPKLLKVYDFSILSNSSKWKW